MILTKVFELCVPRTYRIEEDRTAFLAMVALKTTFTYEEVKVEVIIRYMDQILRLIRIVLNFQQYFRK